MSRELCDYGLKNNLRTVHNGGGRSKGGEEGCLDGWNGCADCCVSCFWRASGSYCWDYGVIGVTSLILWSMVVHCIVSDVCYCEKCKWNICVLI